MNNDYQNWTEREKIVSVVREDGITIFSSEDGYELIFTHVSGGKIYRHILVDTFSKDHGEILEVALDKAALGCTIHILPVLKEGDPIREFIFNGAKERKCPDLKIDGCFTEIKTPTGTLHLSKIGNNIKFAHNQANDVILRLHEEFDIKQLERIAKGRFISHSSLSTVEFKMNGIYHCFKRSDLL